MARASLIIPVFNCEGLLRRCLDSVCGQTLDKNAFELLLIDDASTDSSGSICDEYADQHDWITVVHLPQNTGSASGPRNKGVAIAQGEYVCFADPDDWLAPDCLRRLLEHADAGGHDFVVGRVIQADRWKLEGIVAWCRSNKGEWKSADLPNTWEFYATIGPWSRLVKKDLLEENEISFPEGVYYYDDMIWNIQVLHVVENPLLVNDYDYYFLRRDQGIEHWWTNRASFSLTSLERLYHSVDYLVELLDGFGYSDTHVVFKKLFMVIVHEVLDYIDRISGQNSEAAEEWRKRVWQRVRKHYSPWVRMNMPLGLVCQYDALEAEMEGNCCDDPIRYCADVRAPAGLQKKALDALSEEEVEFPEMPAFLSREAKIRLVARQAASYAFYAVENCVGEDGLVSGEYSVPLKVTDQLAVTMQCGADRADEFEMTRYAWGEDYQEKGTWSARLDSADSASLNDFHFVVSLGTTTLIRHNAKPWNQTFNRPVDNATILKAKHEKELGKANRKLDQTNKQLRQANEQLGKANEQLGQANGKIAKLEKELSQTNRRISKMENSRSWRLTKPLRKLAGHD